jgi:hypothetical protein
MRARPDLERIELRARQLRDLLLVLDCLLPPDVREAFLEMQEKMQEERDWKDETNLRQHVYETLTVKQHAWVRRELDKHRPSYENLVSSGSAPRGREVELMVRDKPLRPPGR